MMVINKCCWIMEVKIFMYSNQKKKLGVVKSICSCNSSVKRMCHVLSCCSFNFLKILIIFQNIDVTLLKPSKINLETYYYKRSKLKVYFTLPSQAALPKASRALILLTTLEWFAEKTHYNLHKYPSPSKPTNS